MPEMVGYRCKNCGEGFVIEVLTKDEVKERRKLGLPTAPITCPKCGSDRVKRAGWDSALNIRVMKSGSRREPAFT